MAISSNHKSIERLLHGEPGQAPASPDPEVSKLSESLSRFTDSRYRAPISIRTSAEQNTIQTCLAAILGSHVKNTTISRAQGKTVELLIEVEEQKIQGVVV